MKLFRYSIIRALAAIVAGILLLKYQGATLKGLTIGLGLMFLVFLVLDQYNPMMNFINNNISRTLLALFCLCSIARSIYDWYMEEKSL